MQKIRRTDLKQRVKLAVRLFTLNDKKLLELKAHEQAVSHRIAVYLECLLKGYNIDCEYNKHGDLSKKIDVDLQKIDIKDLEGCPCTACKKILKKEASSEIEERFFRPDILVHTRNTDENNYIAIEIKKNKFCPFDEAKLLALTDKKGNYEYKLGVFLYFPKGVATYKWYP